MTIKATRIEAMKLLMEGSKALAQVEANGIRVDMQYLLKAEKKVIGMIDDLEEELKKDEVYGLWQKTFKEKMKLGSTRQLSVLLFDKMGYEPIALTDTEQYKTDKLVLEHIDIPFTRNYIYWKELMKARKSLEEIRSETIDGFIHPFQNLHTTKSYRSSSSNPNGQNWPTRNKKISEIIRSCFIPRNGNVIIEEDFGSHEVKISACHNKDPVLIKYIKDPNSDMHRDIGMDLFILTKEDIVRNKDEVKQFGDVRFYAKNQFTFAEFYGSYYKLCAPLLWQSIERFKLKTKQGISLIEHLKSKGIKRLGYCDHDKEPKKGTFEYHVMNVERRLWDRFKVYAKWKQDYWESYKRKGYIDYPTGFRAEGVYRKNVVLSISIQGSSFHCLLWTLIELQKWLNKYKMKTLIINQIHDAINLDVPENEVEDITEKVRELAEVDLLKEWRWIIVPLSIETEICYENWFKKDKFDLVKWGER